MCGVADMCDVALRELSNLSRKLTLRKRALSFASCHGLTPVARVDARTEFVTWTSAP